MSSARTVPSQHRPRLQHDTGPDTSLLVRTERGQDTKPKEASESGCLQPSDIILSFDGIDIANDGTGMSHLPIF